VSGEILIYAVRSAEAGSCDVEKEVRVDWATEKLVGPSKAENFKAGVERRGVGITFFIWYLL
jgi:hypothetical protein